MTREQLDRLSRLLTDTAQTASTVRNKIRISRFANTFIRHLYPFHL